MTTSSFNRPIALISALPEEMEALSTKISEQQIIDQGSDRIIQGSINGIPVVATLSGMGKVNAAMTTQKLISEHQAKAIIFTGVAGGLNKNLNVGDILIGHTVFQHDFGFLGSSFKTYAVGVLPEIGIGNGKESIYFNLRGAHFDRALQILMGLQNTLEPVEVNQRLYHPRITTGAIATGDQFIANESRRSELLVLGADAVEMEGAAITQVAFKSSIPCFVIRAISDKAGEHANFDFRRFLSVVATNNAKLVTHLFLKETPAACL